MNKRAPSTQTLKINYATSGGGVDTGIKTSSLRRILLNIIF